MSPRASRSSAAMARSMVRCGSAGGASTSTSRTDDIAAKSSGTSNAIGSICRAVAATPRPSRRGSMVGPTARTFDGSAEARYCRTALGRLGAGHDRGQRPSARWALAAAASALAARAVGLPERLGLGHQHRLRFGRPRFDVSRFGRGRRPRGHAAVALGGGDDVFDRRCSACRAPGRAWLRPASALQALTWGLRRPV